MAPRISPTLIARYEVRDLSAPLALGRVFSMGLPDSVIWVEDEALGVSEPIRVRVVHVDVPFAPPVQGAYLRTDRMEWTLVVAEAARFDGIGAEQRLFAAVRDQAMRNHEKQIADITTMPELRPAGSGRKPVVPKSYVPRAYALKR